MHYNFTDLTESSIPVQTIFFFLLLFVERVRVIAMLSTSYECRGCPGVVVDCKTFFFSAHLRKTDNHL